MPKRFQNYIDGRWVDAISGKTFENRNPANWDEVIGTFPLSSKEEVDQAVKAARRAFESLASRSCTKTGRHHEKGRRYSHSAKRRDRQTN